LYILCMTQNAKAEKCVKHCIEFLRKKWQREESNDLQLLQELNVVYDTFDADEEELQVDEKESTTRREDNESRNEFVECQENEMINSNSSNYIFFIKVFWKIITSPIKIVLFISIPNCEKSEKRIYLFPLSFAMIFIWIALFAYILVWFITLVGFNLNIPDTVMGLIVISAGISIPDAILSIIVARDGEGDMALTNAIASNIIDILICLGLPWFLKTVIISPGSVIPTTNKGLEYSTISLLVTVIFFLLVTHAFEWRLNMIYGVVMMVWYIFFMILASLYEFNVFGQFTLPTCSRQIP